MGDWLNAVSDNLAKLEQQNNSLNNVTFRGKFEVKEGGKRPIGENDQNFVKANSAMFESGGRQKAEKSTQGEAPGSQEAGRKNVNWNCDKRPFRNPGLERLNEDLSRHRESNGGPRHTNKPGREKPASKIQDSDQLLEIRPTYVENIPDHNSIKYPKKSRGAAAGQIKADGGVDPVRSQKLHSILSNEAAPKTGPQSAQEERGFIMADGTRNSTLKTGAGVAQDQASTRLAQQLESNRADKAVHSRPETEQANKCETGMRPDNNVVTGKPGQGPPHKCSKGDQKNFVLVHNSPYYPLSDTSAALWESAASRNNSGLSESKPRFVDDGVFGSWTPKTRREARSGDRRPSAQDRNITDSYGDRVVTNAKAEINIREKIESGDGGSNGKNDAAMMNKKKDWMKEVHDKLNELKSLRSTGMAGDQTKVKIPFTEKDSLPNMSKTLAQSRIRDSSKKKANVKNVATKQRYEDIMQTNKISREEIESLRNKGRYSQDLSSAVSGNRGAKSWQASLEKQAKVAPGKKQSGTYRFGKPRGEVAAKPMGKPEKLKSDKVPITELKPEVTSKLGSKRAGAYTKNFEKSVAEPFLFVKPEEVVKKERRSATAGSEKNVSPFSKSPNISSSPSVKPHVTPTLTKGSVQLPSVDDHEAWSRLLLSRLSDYHSQMTVEESDQLDTTRSSSSDIEHANMWQKANTGLGSNVKASTQPEARPLGLTHNEIQFSDTTTDQSSGQSDNLYQRPAKQVVSPPDQSRATSPTVLRNRELIKELRKQWSQDFELNFLKMQNSGLSGYKPSENKEPFGKGSERIGINEKEERKGKKKDDEKRSTKTSNISRSLGDDKMSQFPFQDGPVGRRDVTSKLASIIGEGDNMSTKSADQEKFGEKMIGERKPESKFAKENYILKNLSVSGQSAQPVSKPEVEESQEMDPYEEWIQTRAELGGGSRLQPGKSQLQETRAGLEGGPHLQSTESHKHGVGSGTTGNSASIISNKINSKPYLFAHKVDNLHKPSRHTKVDNETRTKVSSNDGAPPTSAPLIYKDIRETYLANSVSRSGRSGLSMPKAGRSSSSGPDVAGVSRPRERVRYKEGMPDVVLGRDAVLPGLIPTDPLLGRYKSKKVSKKKKKKFQRSSGQVDYDFPYIDKKARDSWDGMAIMTVKPVCTTSSASPSPSVSAPPSASPSPKPSLKKFASSSSTSAPTKHVWFQNPETEEGASQKRRGQRFMAKQDMFLDGDFNEFDRRSKVRDRQANEYEGIDKWQQLYDGSRLRARLSEEREKEERERHKELVDAYQKNIERYEKVLERYRNKLRRAIKQPDSINNSGTGSAEPADRPAGK